MTVSVGDNFPVGDSLCDSLSWGQSLLVTVCMTVSMLVTVSVTVSVGDSLSVGDNLSVGDCHFLAKFLNKHLVDCTGEHLGAACKGSHFLFLIISITG